MIAVDTNGTCHLCEVFCLVNRQWCPHPVKSTGPSCLSGFKKIPQRKRYQITLSKWSVRHGENKLPLACKLNHSSGTVVLWTARRFTARLLATHYLHRFARAASGPTGRCQNRVVSWFCKHQNEAYEINHFAIFLYRESITDIFFYFFQARNSYNLK